MSRRCLSAVVAALMITGSTSVTAGAAPQRVRLLGEQIVPLNLQFQGTTVGGLSSIDRDPWTGEYVMTSDDRSAIGPARFYTAKIDVDANGIHGVRFTGTHPYLRPDGKTYPPLKECLATPCSQADATVDPEELRVDPWTGNITWSQEGERIVPNTLFDPSIRQARRDGSYLSQLPLPANEHMSAQPVGPRQNQTLEGFTYAAAGTLLVSELEDPLLQDGPNPSSTAGALSRITVQTRFGHVLAQYAYPLEPLFAAPKPPNSTDTNGVSSMVAYDPLDPTRYLMVERAYASGVGNKVRVYEIDTKGATDIKNVHSLAGTNVRPVSKKLLVDMDTLGLSKVDNIEGITWGPRLPSGERTLLLVSDNNFSAAQVTQVIALAVR